MKITIPILIPVEPRTKKNSMRLVKIGGRIVPILRCLFYMKTRRKVDLTNLLEAADDVLVKYHVLVDDNSQIVAGHDGSRVLYDKSNPRIEIDITEEV